MSKKKYKFLVVNPTKKADKKAKCKGKRGATRTTRKSKATMASSKYPHIYQKNPTSKDDALRQAEALDRLAASTSSENEAKVARLRAGQLRARWGLDKPKAPGKKAPYTSAADGSVYKGKRARKTKSSVPQSASRGEFRALPPSPEERAEKWPRWPSELKTAPRKSGLRKTTKKAPVVKKAVQEQIKVELAAELGRPPAPAEVKAEVASVAKEVTAELKQELGRPPTQTEVKASVETAVLRAPHRHVAKRGGAFAFATPAAAASFQKTAPVAHTRPRSPSHRSPGGLATRGSSRFASTPTGSPKLVRSLVDIASKSVRVPRELEPMIREQYSDAIAKGFAALKGGRLKLTTIGRSFLKMHGVQVAKGRSATSSKKKASKKVAKTSKAVTKPSAHKPARKPRAAVAKESSSPTVAHAQAQVAKGRAQAAAITRAARSDRPTAVAAAREAQRALDSLVADNRALSSQLSACARRGEASNSTATRLKASLKEVEKRNREAIRVLSRATGVKPRGPKSSPAKRQRSSPSSTFTVAAPAVASSRPAPRGGRPRPKTLHRTKSYRVVAGDARDIKGAKGRGFGIFLQRDSIPRNCPPGSQEIRCQLAPSIESVAACGLAHTGGAYPDGYKTVVGRCGPGASVSKKRSGKKLALVGWPTRKAKAKAKVTGKKPAKPSSKQIMASFLRF